MYASDGILMALGQEGKVKLGGVEIKLKVNEPEIIKECGQRLIALRQLKHVWIYFM